MNASEAIAELIQRLESRRKLQRDDGSLADWGEASGLDAAIAQADMLLAEITAEIERPMDVLDEWNRVMRQKCQLTDKRRASCNARMKDAYFLANWRRAIRRAAASPFCSGQNDRGWKADFEWFIRPDSVAKLMEGKYDSQTAGAKF